LSRLSVLLPLYNARSTLERAWRSLRWQTFTDWEAVVVDDGSTDGSLELAARLAEEDPRLKLLPRPHEGLVAALNAGLAHCQAPLVARMDADDLCHPRRLELQVEYLETHPQTWVVGSLVRIFPRATLTPGMAVYEEWLNSLLEPEQMAREIFVESPLVHPSVVLRREALERLGGYRQAGWAEDYDLWLRMWEAGGRFGKVDRVLFWWRDWPGRLTRTSPACDIEAFVRLKVEFLLRTHLAGEGPVLLWGATRSGRRFLRELRRRGVEVAALVDPHPGPPGRRVGGLPVLSPEQLPPEPLLLVAAGLRARHHVGRLLGPRPRVVWVG
jgi:glycosyltransferase involved in cell wall biosynthesis